MARLPPKRIFMRGLYVVCNESTSRDGRVFAFHSTSARKYHFRCRGFTIKRLANALGGVPSGLEACRGPRRGGDGNFHLGTSSGLAPDAELSANAVGSLPHPVKTPVRCSAESNYLGIDARTVVTNSEAQLGREILNFGLDLSGLRMAGSVRQGFARDEKNLFLHARLQRFRATQDRDFEAGAIVHELV